VDEVDLFQVAAALCHVHAHGHQVVEGQVASAVLNKKNSI
jgi:hypothetical protein